MPDYDWVFYDTATLATSAGDIRLFDTPEGKDSSHNGDITNFQNNGQFPESETFTIREIGAYLDAEASEANSFLAWYKQRLKITRNQSNILDVPLVYLASHDAWNGVVTQASAAAQNWIGRLGKGMMLETPIVLEGGVSFNVTINQFVAMTGTTQLMKVYLRGTWDRPV